jgi:hypothetical protein
MPQNCPLCTPKYKSVQLDKSGQNTSSYSTLIQYYVRIYWLLQRKYVRRLLNIQCNLLSTCVFKTFIHVLTHCTLTGWLLSVCIPWICCKVDWCPLSPWIFVCRSLSRLDTIWLDWTMFFTSLARSALMTSRLRLLALVDLLCRLLRRPSLQYWPAFSRANWSPTSWLDQ